MSAKVYHGDNYARQNVPPLLQVPAKSFQPDSDVEDDEANDGVDESHVVKEESKIKTEEVNQDFLSSPEGDKGTEKASKQPASQTSMSMSMAEAVGEESTTIESMIKTNESAKKTAERLIPGTSMSNVEATGEGIMTTESTNMATNQLTPETALSKFESFMTTKDVKQHAHVWC
jgi:hypothetical protein